MAPNESSREQNSGRTVTSTLVAREFVELAKAENPPGKLTVLKLIALTYIAHGWSFAELGRGLVDESVLAWPYGPAFRDLYGAIRAFGHEHPVVNVPPSQLEWEHQGTKLTKNEEEIIKSVYNEYKDVSENVLIEQSRKSGTPWSITWDESLPNHIQQKIDNRLTYTHFSRSRST